MNVECCAKQPTGCKVTGAGGAVHWAKVRTVPALLLSAWKGRFFLRPGCCQHCEVGG